MHRLLHFLNDQLFLHCHCGKDDPFLHQLAQRVPLWRSERDPGFAGRHIKRDMPLLPAESPDARSLFANPSLN